MRSRFRHEYGSSSAHLLLGLVSLVITGLAVSRIFELSRPLPVLLWLAGAVVAHDMVLLPAYSALGRVLERMARVAARNSAEPDARAASTLNHVRIPAMISALLLLLFFPLVLSVAPDTYEGATAMTTDVFLGRWLVITAVVFVVSAVHYVAVSLRARGSVRT